MKGAIDDLCRMIAVSAVLQHALPIILFLVNRLRRTASRFATLLARFQAGTLTPPRERATKSGGKPPEHRFPTRKAWLIRLFQPTAFFQYRMHLLLADPHVQALIEAAPRQAGRLLRPLCQMVGADLPDALKRPRRRKPRPKPEPRPKRPPPLTRARIHAMTAQELTAHFGPLPPHFRLPIPNLTLIRRKIAAG